VLNRCYIDLYGLLQVVQGVNSVWEDRSRDYLEMVLLIECLPQKRVTCHSTLQGRTTLKKMAQTPPELCEGDKLPFVHSDVCALEVILLVGWHRLQGGVEQSRHELMSHRNRKTFELKPL